MTIIIYASAAEKIEKKLSRLSKKAFSYGCEFNYSISEPFPQEIAPSEIVCGTVVKKPAIVVEAVSVEVCFNSMISCYGWSVVAHIEHGAEGNIVTAFNKHKIKKEWYSVPSYCDHCNTNRRRKTTFIVENEQGEQKQVGKSCLKDYTGINPAAVVAAEEVKEFIANESVYNDNSGQMESMLETEFVLALAVDSVKENGYICASEKRNTKGDVLSRLGEHKAPSKEAQQTAKEIMGWLSTIDEIGITQDCKPLALSGFCKYKHVGRLAFMPIAYANHLEKIAKQKRIEAEKSTDRCSKYVGAEGEKITLVVDKAQLLTSWENAYGTTYLYKFVSASNVFVWFASREIEINDGMTIKGTVKTHNNRDGVKQTVLTRCKAV